MTFQEKMSCWKSFGSLLAAICFLVVVPPALFAQAQQTVTTEQLRVSYWGAYPSSPFVTAQGAINTPFVATGGTLGQSRFGTLGANANVIFNTTNANYRTLFIDTGTGSSTTWTGNWTLDAMGGLSVVSGSTATITGTFGSGTNSGKATNHFIFGNNITKNAASQTSVDSGGTLILNGDTRSFVSGLYLYNGTIRLGTNVNTTLDNVTSVQIGAGGILDLNGKSQTLKQLRDNTTSPRVGAFPANYVGGTITNNSSTAITLTLTYDRNQTFSGSIKDGNSGVGKISLAVDMGVDSRTLTLAGANAYSGDTTVAVGELKVTGTLGSVSGSTYTYAGNLYLTGGNLTMSNPNASVRQVLTGTIIGGNSLIKEGASTLYLHNINNINNLTGFSGGTQIRGGILEVDSAEALGHGQVIFNPAPLQTATLEIMDNTTMLQVLAFQGAGVISVLGGKTLTLGSAVAVGTGHVTFAGAGGKIVAGHANQFDQQTGGVAVDTGVVFDMHGYTQTLTKLGGAGTITNSVAGSAVKLIVDTGVTAAGEIPFTGTITDGAGGGVIGLVVTGSRKFTLSTPNNYSGGTILQGGILSMTGAGSIGSGELRFQGGTLEVTENMTVHPTRDIYIDTAGTFSIAAGKTLTMSQNVFNPDLNGTSKTRGTLTLTGAGSFKAYPDGPSEAFLHVNAVILDATFDLNGTDSQTLTNLSGTVNGVITNSVDDLNTALTLRNTRDTVFFGEIEDGVVGTVASTGIVNLIKVGGGVFTLQGIGTYAGDTEIKEGTFAIGKDGTLGTVAVPNSGNFIVSPGAALRTAIVKRNGDWVSNFVIDSDYELEFAPDSIWQVDTSDLHGETVSEIVVHGTINPITIPLIQAALDRGNSQYFYGMVYTERVSSGVGEGIITMAPYQTAHLSDIYLNALLLHDPSTVRTSANDRIDYNFQQWKRSAPNVRGQSEHQKRLLSDNAIWVNYVARANRVQSTFDDYNGRSAKIGADGIQFGMDIYASPKSQVGVLFGYEFQHAALASDQIKAYDYYMGLYAGRKLFAGLDVRAMAGYGHQTYKICRLHNVGMHAGLYHSDPSGNTSEVSVELGRRFNVTKQFSFRPVLGADFYTNAVGKEHEVFGPMGLQYTPDAINYGDMSLTQLYWRIGTDAQLTSGRWNFNGGLAYSHQMLRNGDLLRTHVSTGEGANWLFGSDLGNSVCRMNVGVNVRPFTRVTAFGNYFGDAYLDRAGSPFGSTGQLGLQYTF